MTYLESLSNCLSINTSSMTIGSLVHDIWGFKGWQPRPFLPKLSHFGGPYLPHHWSDWPKILDLVLWVPNQHVCQVSLKSETVGFNSLGDLTQNDSVVVCLHRLWFHCLCPKFWWWFVVVCGDVWWFWFFSGGLRRFVVICGNLWWFVF